MLLIRQARIEDSEAIVEVVRLAFETAEMTDHDEHHLVERLRKSEAFVPELSLVAELEDELIGHILFTKVKVGEEVALALAPLSVLPEYQDQGVGARLIERGHQVAENLGFSSSIVLGHPTYYPKFGYLPASDQGIQAPFEVPDEAFMVKAFVENLHIAGTVEYSAAFFLSE